LTRCPTDLACCEPASSCRECTPEFPLQWALKDVELALQAAGADKTPLLAALARQWRAAVDAGHGRQDISAARLALDDRTS
jgi:3-hydroxyisobutyrate dehydrogenase